MSLEAMTWALRSKIYSSEAILRGLRAAQITDEQFASFVDGLHQKKPTAPLVISPKFGGRSIHKGTRAKVFERDSGACVKCGSKEDITIDHIVPVSQGGSSRYGNLQTLCRRCNSSKRDRRK
jgi:hypothetical protein